MSNNLLEFFYQISPRNDAMEKRTLDMDFLKDGSKGRKLQSPMYGVPCRRVTKVYEKALKVCMAALIYLTYFTNLPRASFFREIQEG